MDWALDQLGNRVDAATRGYLPSRLRCPSCKEDVYRRAGEIRRPYFAHYSHGAKPGCELYASWTSSSSLDETSVLSIEALRSNLRRSSIAFQWDRLTGPALLLRLPRLLHPPIGEGSLRLSGAEGTKYFRPSNLQSRIAFPIRFKLPLFDASGTGVMKEVEEDLLNVARAFDESFNIFSSEEDGGRLVTTYEYLELGRTYWVLSRSKLDSIPPGSSMVLLAQHEEQNWSISSIHLGRGASSEELTTAALASAYLRHPVRAPGTRAIPTTSPHHFEEDGTLVFPTGTRSIPIRRTAIDSFQVISGSGSESPPKIEWHSEFEGEITAIDCSEIALFCGRQVQFTATFSECPLFQPTGVQGRTISGDRELFDVELQLEVCAVMPDNFQLIFPSPRTMKSAELDVSNWSEKGTTLTLLADHQSGTVDAGAFGSLRFDSAVRTSTDIGEDAAATWARGILARAGVAQAFDLRHSILEQLSTQKVAPAWLGIHLNSSVRT